MLLCIDDMDDELKKGLSILLLLQEINVDDPIGFCDDTIPGGGRTTGLLKHLKFELEFASF